MSEIIRVAKAIDQRININEDPVLILQESVPSIQFNNLQVNGSVSVNPVFNLTIPPSQGLSREVFMAFDITFQITGTNLTQYSSYNAIALRAFPLNSCMSDCIVNLGTTGVNMRTQLYQPLFTQWNFDAHTQVDNCSSFPSAPDVYANYSDAVGASNSPFESARSTGVTQFTNSSRTGQITSIVVNSATSMTVTASIIEPIMVSPFTYTGVKDPKKAFFNLSNVTINLSFSNLPRMLCWASVGGSTITSVIGTFTSQELIYDVVSPFEDSLLNQVRPTTYNYTYTQISSSGFTSGAYGTKSSSVSTNVLSFPIIPSHFAIWAMPPPSAIENQTLSFPDIVFSLSNVNINFVQRNNLIGTNARPIQLYNISKKNGSNTTYPQWTGANMVSSGSATSPNYGGGVMIIDAAADLSLPKSSCVGMSYQANFQLTCDITNNSSINWSTYGSCQLFVAAFTPGTCTIAYGGAVDLVNGAGITKQMYDEAPPLTDSSDKLIKASYSSNGYSGGSWSSFMNAMKPYLDPIGQALSRKAVGAIETMGAGRMNRDKVRGKISGLLKNHF